MFNAGSNARSIGWITRAGGGGSIPARCTSSHWKPQFHLDLSAYAAGKPRHTGSIATVGSVERVAEQCARRRGRAAVFHFGSFGVP
jgi:hypothetical protein